MLSLRDLAAADLSITLEGEYGMNVSLISPDGVRQDFAAVQGVEGIKRLRGQVLYDTVRLNPENGDRLIINQPVISLRRASLLRVPVAGENWIIEFPESPITGAPIVQHSLSPVRPPEGGSSIGFIRLYTQVLEQSDSPPEQP